MQWLNFRWLKTNQEAKLLRESGVDVYAVGYGNGDIKDAELRRIAGDDKSRWMRVKNIDNLKNAMSSLSKKICEKVRKFIAIPCLTLCKLPF